MATTSAISTRIHLAIAKKLRDVTSRGVAREKSIAPIGRATGFGSNLEVAVEANLP
jgi:hypothetical protein